MRSIIALLAIAATTTGAPPAVKQPEHVAPATEAATQYAPVPAGANEEVTASSAQAAFAPFRRSSTVVPFAPQFAGLDEINSPAGWKGPSHDAALEALMGGTPAKRQAARWDYARSNIGRGRAAEALGALEVMQQDEIDIGLVPSFKLALGAALVQLHRPTAAIAALSSEALVTNPEACAWRMRALAQGGEDRLALRQVNCAIPALNQRHGEERAPFLLAVATSAARTGNPALVIELLRTMAEKDPAANLLRGRALIVLGKIAPGQLLLARVARTGDYGQRLDAELSRLEAKAGTGRIPADTMARLRRIRFVWRGGDIEQRALGLAYYVSKQTRDMRGTLEAGATLFRYFGGGAHRATLLADLQATLTAILSPQNPMPLDQVAGLYWDYRDLSPAAAAGDLLVSQFAARLQASGLYERAAELLEYQLLARTQDVAQGPLSAQVASLFILAGKPGRALDAIRETEGNAYPDDILWARHRVEAVALDKLGRANEALAVLQDVPDGDAIRSEFYWKRRDWKALAEATETSLGAAEPLTEVVQAKILRYAIALAMLGREAELGRLHDRYVASFAKLPSAATFNTLTGSIGTIDPALMSTAMAAIPSASPAGEIADLVDSPPMANSPIG
jgi:hypothetical protein